MTQRIFLAFLIALLVRLAPAWAEGSFRTTPPLPPIEYTEPYNVQGFWWGSPANSEPGWGLGISHQGSTLLVTWLAYDADGNPVWHVAPNVAWNKYSATYRGRLYQTTGAAFSDVPWSAAKVKMTDVGEVVLWFGADSQGSFQYTLSGSGGITATKPITRYVFESRAASCAWTTDSPYHEPNYTDTWWHAPYGSVGGWGLNVAHQDDVVFATWFTFKADGTGEWIAMPDAIRVARGTYAGTLYRMQGPPLRPGKWDASKVTATPVGTAMLNFPDPDYGTFTYTLDGVTQSRDIGRYSLVWPPTDCE